MAATRLCRNDSGQLIDALKDLSVLLENLGIENGNLILAADGNIYGTFVIDTNEFTVSITEDGKRRVSYLCQLKNFQTMIMNGMKLRKQGFIDCMSD